jgi:fructokinase
MKGGGSELILQGITFNMALSVSYCPDSEVSVPSIDRKDINALGCCGVPITSVGDDDRGRRALAELSGRGLDTSTIDTVPGHATGYVEVKTDENGIASYIFPADLAWDHPQVNRQASDMASRFDAICFGTLGQRSAEAGRTKLSFVDGLPKQVLRICDLNFRQHFYSREIIEGSLARADILKLIEFRLLR